MKINCLSLVFSLFVLLNIGCSSNENLSEDSEIIDEIIDDDEETEEEEEEEEEKSWIKQGADVWVWDVDNLDLLDRNKVFAAIVRWVEDEPDDVYQEYWKLEFEHGETWRYPTYCMFQSEAQAKLDMEANASRTILCK
jgi:hypothetical protein